MVPTPRGWIRHVRGDRVRLRAPREFPVGEFSYCENYGPLRTARQVMASKLTVVIPGFELGEVAPPRRLATREGEHAALLTMQCTMASRPARRVMGVVFGDHFTTLLDGLSIEPELFGELETLARELTERTTLQLGVRRRRFVYAPPAGWQALPNSFVTKWIPQDFPASRAQIIVFPASPAQQTPRDLLEPVLAEERAAGVLVEAVIGPQPVSSRQGLAGRIWQVRTRPRSEPPLIREIVGFHDSLYIYPLCLVFGEGCDPVPARHAFRKVCASIEPVPQAGGTMPETTETLNFWVR